MQAIKSMMPLLTIALIHSIHAQTWHQLESTGMEYLYVSDNQVNYDAAKAACIQHGGDQV